MLINLKKLLQDAEKRTYAIGAFNTSNLEITQAIIRAAIAKRSPVIIQTTESAIEYAGLDNLSCLIHTMAATEGKKIPIVLHLDHGRSVDTVKKVLKAGYNSVMLDGSTLPLKENIRNTKKASDLAHQVGAASQGEIGRLRGAEGGISSTDAEAFLTDPAEAKQFVQKTGIDVLAVSIGTMHGIKKFQLKGGVPHLYLNRLKEIRTAVGQIPIVLHGASGVPQDELRQAIRFGVRVVNIDTELRVAFSKDLRIYLAANKDAYDPRTILTHVTAAVQKTVEKKMEELGSANKI